ncbi:MAG: monovalent cation/H+ antiporter complex subunit F [Ornithinimicrobium sp.]
MTLIVVSTIIILAVAAVCGLVRLVTAKDEATAAAVSDLIYFCAIAIFIVSAMLRNTAVLFDVASVSALFGILATVALARILTRGRR